MKIIKANKIFKKKNICMKHISKIEKKWMVRINYTLGPMYMSWSEYIHVRQAWLYGVYILICFYVYTKSVNILRLRHSASLVGMCCSHIHSKIDISMYYIKSWPVFNVLFIIACRWVVLLLLLVFLQELIQNMWAYIGQKKSNNSETCAGFRVLLYFFRLPVCVLSIGVLVMIFGLFRLRFVMLFLVDLSRFAHSFEQIVWNRKRLKNVSAVHDF